MSVIAIPKLPNRLPEPYIRPVEARGKSMTIGFGFNCRQSLVLGADRQMTTQGINKFFEEKLFFDLDDRALVMLGADDFSLAKEAPISAYTR